MSDHTLQDKAEQLLDLLRPLVVSRGPLGASDQVALDSARVTFWDAILTADVVLTISGLVAGAAMHLNVKQDSVGGHSLIVSDGSTALTLAIDTSPNATNACDIQVDANGVDLIVTGA